MKKIALALLAFFPLCSLADETELKVDGFSLATGTRADIEEYDNIRAGKSDRGNNGDWEYLATIYMRLCKILGIPYDWLVENAMRVSHGYNLTQKDWDDFNKIIENVRGVLKDWDAKCEKGYNGSYTIEECPSGSAYPTGLYKNGKSFVYKCMRMSNGDLLTYDKANRSLLIVGAKKPWSPVGNAVDVYCFTNFIVNAGEIAIDYVPVSSDDVKCDDYNLRTWRVIPSGTEYTGGRNLSSYFQIIAAIKSDPALDKNPARAATIDSACRDLISVAKEIRMNYAAVGEDKKEYWGARSKVAASEIDKLNGGR